MMKTVLLIIGLFAAAPGFSQLFPDSAFHLFMDSLHNPAYIPPIKFITDKNEYINIFFSDKHNEIGFEADSMKGKMTRQEYALGNYGNLKPDLNFLYYGDKKAVGAQIYFSGFLDLYQIYYSSTKINGTIYILLDERAGDTVWFKSTGDQQAVLISAKIER